MMRSSQQQGFTAVIIAMLFIAFAVIAAIVVERNTTMQQITRRDRAIEQLTKLSNAIIEYSVFNQASNINYYPCPAQLNLAATDPSFGDALVGCSTTVSGSVDVPGAPTNTAVIRGMVPVLKLSTYGITIEDAFDPWNNRIVYVVNRHLTAGSASGSGAQTDNPTLTDARTGYTLAKPDFMLISYGRDGKGGIKRNDTTTTIPCAASSVLLREENCDTDIDFKTSPTFTASIATSGTYFDDVLTWYSANNTVASTNYTLYCWGWNNKGQIGDGTTTSRDVPTLASSTNFKYVSTGIKHACAIAADDLPYCWGYNDRGQLGDTTLVDHTAPAAVTLPSGVASFTSISAGNRFSCGLGNNGRAYCWGANDNNQLGNGTGIDSLIPVAVALPGAVTSYTAVSTGGSHACGIGNDGRAYCWGNGGFGQIGDGAAVSRSTPTAVNLPGGVTSYTAISAGSNYSCGIGNNGQAYCWGLANYYQLGNGTSGSSLIPVQVALAGTATSYTSISAGLGGTTCAIGNNGQAYCWGQNNSGQTGRGNTANPQESVLQVNVVGTATGYTAISTGSTHTCGVGNNGKAYCWGDSGGGSPLGNGPASVTTSTPVQATMPGGITNFSAVASGESFTCGLGL